MQANTQQTADLEHLNVLGILHYVLGGITLAMGFCPSMHVYIGLSLLSGREPFTGEAVNEPAFVGVLFAGMGLAFMLGAWLLGMLLLIAGGRLRRVRNRTFCLIVAGVSCAMVPLGTVLGVFTIIVLVRPSVQELFAAPARA